MKVKEELQKKRLQCSFWMLDAVSCYAKDVTQISFSYVFWENESTPLPWHIVEAWKILQFSTGFLRTHLKLLSLAN